MGIRIEKIDLLNIGPFGQIRLTFPKKTLTDKAEIHILTGENGTGKSTVLETIVACLIRKVSPEFFMKWRIKKDEKNGAQLSFNYNFNGVSKDFAVVLVPSGSLAKRHLFNHSYWDYFSKPEAAFKFAFFAYSGYRKVFNAQIFGIQELKGHPFDNALDFQKSSDPQQILQWLANTIAAEAIAKNQEEPEEAQSRRRAIQQIEETIGNIIGKKVAFKLETKPFAVKIEVDGERLDFNLLPDGLKSIISWMADLLMRMDRVKWENDTPVFERNFILFLDEIEVHMHPAWQRKILPAVQKLFPNAQIFISTHSPFVVGSVDGAWIHKLVKPNGDSQLAEGFPVLSEDARSYQYWLEEVFDIESPYGLEATTKLERRRALLRQKDLSMAEQAELSNLDQEFDLMPPEESPLGQRIIEHLQKLKSSPNKG